MKRRCTDVKSSNYPRWGGRGIVVCERWASFEAFFEDMGPRPEGYTIDRIDPNGHYTPANCRWAPACEQGALHRRNLRAVTIDGVAYPSLAAAGRAHGVSPAAINARLKRGWSVERAIRAPVNH